MPSFRKGPNRLLKVQSGAQDLARRGRLVQRAHEERDGRVQAALPSPPFPFYIYCLEDDYIAVYNNIRQKTIDLLMDK